MTAYIELKKNEEIKTYIKKADDSLNALGFTEHGFAHVLKVADTARYILQTMDYPDDTIELAQIAGYLHDIGNLINRVEHSQSGAVMAFELMHDLGFSAEDIATVATAIGNHDEGTGVPVNAVAAALIIADKTDVRRSRVRNKLTTEFDIHDWVNYSVTKSALTINAEKTEITLDITIDTEYSSVLDYFQIFLTRMNMCKNAAVKLGLAFRLVINGQQII
ncbi:MAG: HD domain-containing protein [Oscillospiraceae bacterium]|nr:HD domain-containing protein [Oscillospiraceae bacterium]